MKKMFAKLGMPSVLTLVFLLGGLFFGTNVVSAQNTLDSGNDLSLIKTTASWKSPQDAVNALQAEIDGFTDYLNTSNPGNTLQIKMKILVYEGIIQSVESGYSVPSAAHINYYKYAPGEFKDYVQIFGMSNNDWTELFNDMMAVLTL